MGYKTKILCLKINTKVTLYTIEHVYEQYFWNDLLGN